MCARMIKDKLRFAMHSYTNPLGSPVFTGDLIGVYRAVHYTQTIHKTYTKKAEHRKKTMLSLLLFVGIMIQSVIPSC